jgi:hypothetical protein
MFSRGHVVMKGGLHVVYRLKDEDITPPEPSDLGAEKGDAIGAFAVAMLTIALIALIIGVQIL